MPRSRRAARRPRVPRMTPIDARYWSMSGLKAGLSARMSKRWPPPTLSTPTLRLRRHRRGRASRRWRRATARGSRAWRGRGVGVTGMVCAASCAGEAVGVGRVGRPRASSCAASTMYCWPLVRAEEQVRRIDVALARDRRPAVARVGADGGQIAGERIARGRRRDEAAGTAAGGDVAGAAGALVVGDAPAARAVKVDVEADARPSPAAPADRPAAARRRATRSGRAARPTRHRRRPGGVGQRQPEVDRRRRGVGRRLHREAAVRRARES